MSDMIKREDVLAIIEERFSGTMIGDILKQDINALPAAEAIYICDRKKCEDCNPLCDFTRDINHAGTIDKALIIDKKKEDIKLAPKGRQCRIDRCELFNRLATITAEDANEMKAKIYAVIQEMPALPDDIVRCKDCKHFEKNESILRGEWWCDLWMDTIEDDGYCSYGERKEGER